MHSMGRSRVPETPLISIEHENPWEVNLSFRSVSIAPYNGRNQGFRSNFSSYAEWEKTYGYNISSDSGSESDNDDSDESKKNGDNKLQEELLRTTQLVYSYQDGKGMVPKLREPRSLFALSKELGPQQAARWPSEIQVLNERIKHLYYLPPEPEPFYKPTGLEKTPMVRGEENGGRLVFMYEPKSCFFMRSRVNGCRTGPEKVTCNLKSPEDKTLLFDSRFESGNLARAVQTNETDYECWLRYDLYTTRNTQWFYFRVSNTRPNVTYRFTIVNFMKPDSLYNYGMRPLMYSQKNADTKKIGWIRCGAEIKYYKNNLKYHSGRGEKPFYSLTWTVQFQHSHDTVYFAHCFPYTYTDLQDYLLDLSNDPIKAKICKQRVLCRTLAGNLVYVLTITSPSQSPEDIKHKKAVVITARVHPGECNSSWMMKGFLDYLVGNSADAKLLRDTFIFKIVPMLNPDGVIVGNYRCSLAGRDLNRNYKTVLKDSYPSVWHTKNMIRRLNQEREIIVYCDLHGHSRKQNVFIYGCENRYSPDKRLKERVFPCMLNKNAPEKFNFDSCKFKVQKSKEGTGRIVMWNMGIMNSYTMEATFCGSTKGKMKGFHFSMSDYESLGFHFCDTLLDYCDPDKTKMNNVMLELEEKLRKEILTRLQRQGVSVDNPSEIDLSDEYDSSLESSDGGSDSSVSDGPPVHLQFAARPYNKKKKKLKSKKDRDKLRSAKDDVKAKERPSSDQCEKKNPHLTSHAKTDKTEPKIEMTTGNSSTNTQHAPQSLVHFFQQKVKTQSMRYMSNSANKNRPKSFEGMNGADRAEDKKDRRNEYLELLTKEYSRNGLGNMQPSETPTQPHFRYSGSGKLSNAMPFQWEGLCPHHEQKVAASIMAAQLTDSVQSGVVGTNLVRIWKERLQRSKYPNGNMEDYVRSQMNQSATSVSSPSSRTPIQRHIVEVSASQQRQQDLLQHKHCENKSAKSGRQRATVPSATFVHYDTQHSNPHLVDKAKSETRLELLERESSQPEHNDTQDRNESFSVEQIGNNNTDDNQKEVEKTKVKERVSSGRRSRMGIRSREEFNPMSVSHPNYLVNPHVKGQSRVQSAKGQKEVDNAIESIKELRQSLVSNATQQNLSPTTGGYIKRLMQETGRDIQNLTNEIKHDIEMKRKMAEDQSEEDPTDEVTIDQVRHIPDSSPPEQFNPSQTAHPYPVFDKNNFVQLDELSGTEALMGKGYPEQWRNLSTQDSSTMTDAPKRSHVRVKKNPVSNYPMSDRTYERNGKGEATPQGNNSNNRRIPDSSVVESYQISTLDRTNYRENVNNSSASSKHSKSGTTYDLRPVTDRNFQEQYIKKSKKAELKETNMSAPTSKDNRTSSSGTAPTVSDRYFEQPNRVRSAKGSSQSKQLAQPSSAAEALPTKIQLMISQDHQEEKCFGGQFLPLSRTIRAPFYRTGTKKK